MGGWYTVMVQVYSTVHIVGNETKLNKLVRPMKEKSEYRDTKKKKNLHPKMPILQLKKFGYPNKNH